MKTAANTLKGGKVKVDPAKVADFRQGNSKDIEGLKAAGDKQATEVVKANKRMAAIWAMYGKVKKPVQIPPEKILVSRANRTPNMQYLHKDLFPGMRDDGYDPTRPDKGFVCEVADMEGLITHNEELGKGNILYPTIVKELVEFECVASNHVTLTLRLVKQGKQSSITMMMFDVPLDDEFFAEAVELGHYYYVFRKDIPFDDKVFVARYKNADHDQSQWTSIAEHIRNMQLVCERAVAECKHVRLATVVAKVMQESLAKLTTESATAIVRLIMDMGISDNINEFLRWYSISVNPKELTVSPAFLGKLMELIGKKSPKACMAILRVHCKDNTVVLAQVRPAVAFLI